MIRKTFIFAIVLCLGIVAYAQDAKKTTKVTGYLIDNMCAMDEEDMAKGHPTACAKMDKCEKSGFAVISKDKSYKLDEEGNKQASEIIKSTKTQKGVRVEVEGTIDGDTLHAEKVTEVF